MPKEKKEMVIDKKTKDKLSKEIFNEIENDIKEDLCKDVVDSVKETIDTEYLDDLKTQVKGEIIDDIKLDIKKDQNKLIRRRAFKIFRMYIYIIALIALVCYLGFRLYKNGELDVFKNQENDNTVVVSTTTITKLVKDLNWYINEYGYLMDNIFITDLNVLKGNNSIAEMDSSIKLGMAYKTMNTSLVSIESVIYSFEGNNLKDAYAKLFGSETGYLNSNFSVDGLNYVYSESTQKYIAIKTDDSEFGDVVNKITDVVESEGSIAITSIVGYVVNDTLYNITDTNTAITSYSDKNTLLENETKLTKVQYVFKNNNGSYYLNSIIRK